MTDDPSRRHRDTLRGAARAVASVLTLCTAVGAAGADARLETADGGTTLREASAVLDIDILGTVAVVEATQVIANPGQALEEAVYTFDLPIDAAVTGLEIRLADGRTSSAAVVDAGAAVKSAHDPDAIAAVADMGLLRLIARDRPDINAAPGFLRATYELRVFPVAAGQLVTVKTRWMAPLRFEDGRLQLRIPQRGDARNLVRERVALTLRAPAGSRGFATVHGGGKLLGKRIERARFTALPQADIVVEAVPELRGPGPLVSFATVPVGGGLGAVGVSVLAPTPRRAASPGFERVVLLVDVSRSMDASGLAAARHIADGLLAVLPRNAGVELVLFDRAAQRVFGRFIDNGRQARKKVAAALRPGQLRNGSDLGAALELIHSLLVAEPLGDRPAEGIVRGVRPPTLVAIIGDGMAPLELDARSALSRLGDEVLSQVEVFSVTLVPDNAPVPEIARSATAALAYATPGRAIAARHGEAADRARKLASDLGRPAPLVNLSVAAGTATTLEGLVIPDQLEPGQGYVGFGFYRGAEPRKLELVAEQRNKPLRVLARRDGDLRRTSLPLALVGASEDSFASIGDLPDTVADEASFRDARRTLVKTASNAGAVTRYSSIVALDGKDRYARDRLAGVAKWGPFVFVRLPPEPERAEGYELVAYGDREVAADPSAGHVARRTGELDRSIIERLLTQHVVPRARACYEKELRKNTALRGSLTVVVEIARGEVQHATIERSTFSAGQVEACVTEAAYSIQVPRVALGDDPETIGVARYPLVFRMHQGSSTVERGEGRRGTIADPTRDPLGGLKRGD